MIEKPATAEGYRSAEDVLNQVRPLEGDAACSKAIHILRRDFLAHDGLGPRRVAEFLTGGPDDAIQADVVGFVSEILQSLDKGKA